MRLWVLVLLICLMLVVMSEARGRKVQRKVQRRNYGGRGNTRPNKRTRERKKRSRARSSSSSHSRSRSQLPHDLPQMKSQLEQLKKEFEEIRRVVTQLKQQLTSIGPSNVVQPGVASPVTPPPQTQLVPLTQPTTFADCTLAVQTATKRAEMMLTGKEMKDEKENRYMQIDCSTPALYETWFQKLGATPTTVYISLQDFTKRINELKEFNVQLKTTVNKLKAALPEDGNKQTSVTAIDAEIAKLTEADDKLKAFVIPV